jgi:alpha-ketoglutarate-dependent taurine dioxygenase
VNEIYNTMEAESVSNPWQKGDLIMLDNVLTCHGRKPFKGDRKIVVSMGN